MKRFLSFLALTLLWPIWRVPAWAQLTTLGVGGIAAVVIGTLITPSIVPQPASYFNQNSANGNTNDALKPNGGAVGAFEGPATTPNSQVFYFEGMTDPVLNYATFGTENAFFGLTLAANSGGQPTWTAQRNAGGSFPGSNWWDAVSYSPATSAPTVGGTLTGYATGYYPATASGGRCSRPPSVVWTGGGKASLSDPGFLCDGVTPTFDLSTIPGDGAQQSTGAGGVATTCASNSPVSGQVTVTTHVAVAHGIAPGQTFPLTLFTPSALNTTYTALPSPTPTTLVGTAAIGSPAGTCPSLSGLVEGKALGGSGGTMTLAAISSTNPFGTGITGITTKNGQKFCGIIGEYGADSNFPGAQFASFVDDKGNALPGAPALVPWLNQGTANFTGYMTVGAQSPSSPALTVTAMNSYTINAATYSGITGYVTFTTTASPGFIPGSEFTVSGVSPPGYNQTYVAVAGTNGTTVVGNPLSGPQGTPQTITNPTGYVSGGAMVSVIMPNMQVLGAASGLVIAPYGTFGGSGVGGVGTYGLVGTPATSTFTAKIDNGAGAAGTTLTTSGTAPAPPIVVGTAISGAGVSAGTIVTAVLSTTTFTVNNSQLVATAESMTNAGTIGSSGSPVNIFSYPGFYYTAVASVTASAPYGGVTTPRTQGTFGDWWSIIGSSSVSGGPLHSGWGGALGNVSMLWGSFPQVTGGAPSTTALASLCKKTTDIQTFAAANSLAVHSLYKLNDLGIWGDSSFATITGYIDSASNTVAGTAALHVLTTPYGSLAPPSNQTATIAAPGLAGAPLSAPTIPLLSSGATSTYTVTFAAGIISANLGSISAPVTFSVGAFKPATPLASGNVMGYIDAPSSVPTLHVTSITPASVAQFTGTLGNTLTGAIPIGNTLNVTSVVGDGYAKIGVGTTIIGAGIPGGTVVTGLVGTANGGVGSYTLNNSVSTAVPSEPMFASGVLPAAADAMEVTSTSGAAITNGMLVTDGNNQITGPPIYVLTSATAVNGVAVWNINPTYYPVNVTYTGMVGTLTALVPGQYIQGATSGVGLTTPVSIIGYGTGFNPANGGTGDYLLSNNSANGIGSLGSPVSLLTTGIGDGGAVAPGAALTIRDLGPGVTFPVTNFGAGTGALTLSGTFDTSVLGGAPTTIQAQVSRSSGGPPVPGCSACAWTNLSGYSVTLSSGTVFDWKGQALNIPAAAGPLIVSVRAANGTAYATMPSLIKVGLVFDWQAEGQGGALAAQESGVANSSFVGLWGLNQWMPGGAPMLDQGPPITGNYVPGQTFMYAGDRFGVLGDGLPFPEGVSVYEQLLTNAFGWPATLVNTARDGIGITPETMGNVSQSQSVGVGDGSTLIWCSQSKFCPTAGISPSGPLFFNAATQTGANIHATISGLTLTTQTLDLGALEPGMTLSDTAGLITGAPTLVSCVSGCIPTGAPLAYPNVQTWTVSSSQTVGTSEGMRAEPTPAAPWPAYDIQSISLSFVNGGFGTQLVKPGTFKVSVNGTVVCQDTTAFAYNNQSGNCIDTGGGVVSSGFINYATGDYGITFASGHAPSSTVPITATWTNIISPDGNTAPTINRPHGLDFFGDGGCQSGPMSAIFCKTPGGVTAHVFAGGASDDSILSRAGFQFGAPAYTQSVSWLYGTRFPSVIPGQSPSTPFISANPWRGEGTSYYPISNGGTGLSTSYALSGQWSIDVAMKSTFSGTIASGTLTLFGAATGPMWEGEVIDCAAVTTNCPLGQSSGVYITGLLTGTWGTSGSTYALAGSPANVSTAALMQNAVYYMGPGPAYYSGPMNDIPVQASTLAATTGYAPHMANGAFAGRRIGARWAAQAWGNLTNTANASDPTVDRVKADAGTNACDTSAISAPCFDVGTGGAGGPYAAAHSGTISGAQITITGGIAANARPFVVGQALFCSGCTTGRFITSIDVPPTQSTVSGAGEVGQTFHITANASLLTGPTTEAVTAGCSGTAGTGSNCIDIAFQINTTNGSYGTAAALATCGENNLNGSAPPYQPPAGICQTNGVGSLVRDFRVGTNQAMWGLLTGFTTGSPYDDGDDPDGGVFNQSAAFTANIVGAKVVQLVKAPTFSGGVPSSIGQWASGSTFVEYGDSVIGTGRLASLQGYVGGQSFPITTPGSGQTNGTYTGVAGTGCGTTSGGVTPKMDLTVVGNVLVNAYPSTAADAMGIGNGTACLFTVPGSAGGTAGTAQTVVAPVEGVGGIATYNTDSNMMGDLLYDNSGLPGNPLNSFFTNGFGGYFEPGLPVVPFGQFMGAQVSG